MWRLAIPLILTLSAAAAARGELELPKESAARLSADLERWRDVDRHHPDYLNASVGYAELLAERAAGPDCMQTLSAANDLLSPVAADRASRIYMDQYGGWMATVGYEIESARARCSDSSAARGAALKSALRFAREAVNAYRVAFDYQAMAAAQFQVARTLRSLGEKAHALQELRVAMDMDGEFGFRVDAEANFRLLNEWQGKKTKDSELREFLAPFARRSATLKFSRQPFRQTGEVAFDRQLFDHGDLKHSRFSIPVTGELKRDGADYLWERTAGELKPDISEGVDPLEEKLVTLAARLLSTLPQAQISSGGQFTGVKRMDELTEQFDGDVEAAVAERVIPGDPVVHNVSAYIDEGFRKHMKRETLLRLYQEGFALETAYWNGMTLQQGQWVGMSKDLSLNGMEGSFSEQHLRVNLARWLSCRPGMDDDSCVELVIEAAPQPDANAGTLDYRSQTRMRVVVDPDTLLPYDSEIIRYSYVGLSKPGKSRFVRIVGERVGSTSNYTKKAAETRKRSRNQRYAAISPAFSVTLN